MRYLKFVPLVAAALVLAGCTATSVNNTPAPTPSTTSKSDTGKLPVLKTYRDANGYLLTAPERVKKYPDFCSTPEKLTQAVLDKINVGAKEDLKAFDGSAMPIKGETNKWILLVSAGTEISGSTVSFEATGKTVANLDGFIGGDGEAQKLFKWGNEYTTKDAEGKAASKAFESYAACFYPLAVKIESTPNPVDGQSESVAK